MIDIFLKNIQEDRNLKRSVCRSIVKNPLRQTGQYFEQILLRAWGADLIRRKISSKCRHQWKSNNSN